MNIEQIELCLEFNIYMHMHTYVVAADDRVFTVHGTCIFIEYTISPCDSEGWCLMVHTRRLYLQTSKEYAQTHIFTHRKTIFTVANIQTVVNGES